MLNLWATNPSPTSRLTTLNPSEKPSTIQWERPSPNPTESTNKPENENERESNISENNNTNKPESDNNPQTDISDSDNDMSDGDDKQQIQRLESQSTTTTSDKLRPCNIDWTNKATAKPSMMTTITSISSLTITPHQPTQYHATPTPCLHPAHPDSPATHTTPSMTRVVATVAGTGRGHPALTISTRH